MMIDGAGKDDSAGSGKISFLFLSFVIEWGLRYAALMR